MWMSLPACLSENGKPGVVQKQSEQAFPRQAFYIFDVKKKTKKKKKLTMDR